jgi:hypothetical protein
MQVSRRNTCSIPFAGSEVRFVAADWKATYLPVWLMDAATALSSFAAEPSGAILINCTTPAVAAAGDRIGKTAALEASPLEVSATVILADPGAATNDAGICTLRNWSLWKTVARGFPFHSTTQVPVKL